MAKLDLFCCYLFLIFSTSSSVTGAPKDRLVIFQLGGEELKQYQIPSLPSYFKKRTDVSELDNVKTGNSSGYAAPAILASDYSGEQQTDFMGYDYPVPSNRLSYPAKEFDFSHKQIIQYERSQGFNSNYNENIAQQMYNFGDNGNNYQSNAMSRNKNYREPALQIPASFEHHNNQEQSNSQLPYGTQKHFSQQQNSEDEGYRYEQPSQMYYQAESLGFNDNNLGNNLVSERVDNDFVRQDSQRDSSIGYAQLNLFGEHIQPLLKQYF